MMPKIKWRNAYRFINPRIDAAGAHVWPFDRSFPLEVHFWSYERPRDIRMNRHEYLELILLDCGEAVFQVQDRYLPIKSGDLFIVGTHLFHRLIYKGVRLESPRIMFLPELVCGARGSKDDSDYLIPFQIQDERFPHIVPAATGIPRQVRELTLKIAGRLPARTHSARLCAKTYLKMILALLVEHYSSYAGSRSTSMSRQRDVERLNAVFKFIEAHYPEAILLEEVASLVPMSPRNFTRFFKKVTGQTFVAYLNCFRVEKAQNLLASGNRTVAEVCYEAGFCSQSYFGTVFRRLVQMSPRQFQRQVANAA